jgi:outer membrane biosynthesis protein TonB
LSDASPSPVPSTAKGVKAGLPKRCWQLGALVVASALAHGLLLAIPLPEAPETEEPKPEEIEIIQEQAMNVARLPQVAVPEAAPPEAAAARNAEPARPQPQTQAPQNRPQESQPSQRPPRPEDVEQPSNSLDQVENLPTGDVGNSPESNQELTFQERLQTPGAYVRDGSPARSFNALLGFEEGETDLVSPWLEKLTDAGNASEPKLLRPSLEFEVEYQLNACDAPLKIPPQKGYLGIALDAEDGILSEIEVLGSSGYSLLDEQATKELEDRTDELPTRDRNTAYLVTFTVTNTRC